MARAARQTTLPPLATLRPDGLGVPRDAERGDVWYGYVPLDDTDDLGIDSLLAHDAGSRALFIDADDDEDLGDDGPPHANEGSGPLLAARVTVTASVRASDGSTTTRPPSSGSGSTATAMCPGTHARMPFTTIGARRVSGTRRTT